MIKIVLAIVAVFVSMIFVPTDAYASFNLWDINEIYSNADGTLQFIELTTFANGEQFVTGHTITSNSDGIVNSFTLINNTPSPTANRTILLATSSLASVPDFPVPDFIIPDNFFNPTANTITLNYGESSDIVTLTSGQLPTDGLESSDDNGNSQLASPTNFNGDTATPPFVINSDASDGTVKSFQKISDTAGSFTATLDNLDSFGLEVANKIVRFAVGDGVLFIKMNVLTIPSELEVIV